MRVVADSGTETWACLAAGDAAIICSGTVTLECAINGLPGVAVYRPDWLSLVIGNALGVKRDNVILANVVAGTRLYPLRLGSELGGAMLAKAVAPLLAVAPETRNKNRQAMQDAVQKAIAVPSPDFAMACLATIDAALAD